MSGRRKHTKRQRGQSSTALLSELAAILELLDSPAEADIPLLDQVAEMAPAAEPEITTPAGIAAGDRLLNSIQSADGKPMDTKAIDQTPLKSHPEPQNPVATGENSATGTTQRETAGAAAPQAQTASENPFLPPHIRARLSGGQKPQERAPEIDAADRAQQPGPAVAIKGRSARRQQLVEQLVAEQLPELERQLRASITLMLDELDSKPELL